MRLYQDLSVQLLSLFSTMSFNQSGQLEMNGFLAQRRSLVQISHPQSKEIYKYYEEHFGVCLVKLEGKRVIQSYLKEGNAVWWKA